MKLTDKMNTTFEYKGLVLKTRPFFNVVLKAFELFQDNRIDTRGKARIAFNMFVENAKSYDLSLSEKSIIVSKIFETLSDEKEDPNQASIGKKEDDAYDFALDADYIYASFLSEYGIDLIEAQNKLHWVKFKALFASLSEDSKIMKVIGYRTAKIPPQNKYNKDEVERMKKLKKVYALKKESTVQSIDDKFDSLASMLKG